MYLIVFNIEQHYYRIFNAVYMIYEEERTKKMISVIKRDGHRATYDRNKIVSAIQKANTEVDQEERISEEQIYNILASIENRGFDEMAVEDIQDIIEQNIISLWNIFRIINWFIFFFIKVAYILIIYFSRSNMLALQNWNTFVDIFNFISKEC